MYSPVEVVDPICLSIKLVETCDPKGIRGDSDLFEVPKCISNCFDDDLVLENDEKRIYVSLGQFSIIRLERDTQLVVPSHDFCLPDKECVGSTEDSPCELFRRIRFPVDEFFPPNVCSYEEYSDAQFKRH